MIDLLKINGTIIPKVKNYRVTHAKLWKDAERNMNGDVRASLIGIFPKIGVSIAHTKLHEIKTIMSLLDLPYFTVEFYDVLTGGISSASYYAGDYKIELLDKEKGLYAPFDFDLIPVSKRR